MQGLKYEVLHFADKSVIKYARIQNSAIQYRKV